ncbi:hypothetical protein [Verrucosispora sp. WMMD1129]|uniref:hypothetical protein n=1 Tax=Verrucosispora sp. WMMD1129 TaxID=3016093 RepID=UPI00249AB07E|nr:hypothetical protein [Verrucosispora sp. WMMD1129]WFE47635.1 hypothetical protein O7624_26580 [Verrucosispora sp. WMMD1129]
MIDQRMVQVPVRAIAEAVLDRVLALGITGRLRPATVAGPAPGGGFLVVMDGDTAVMRVVSLVGVLPKDARVMVLMTPPAGHHVVGYLGVPPQGAYLADTGVVTNELAVAYAAGWAQQDNAYRIVGSRIELNVNVRRTGGPITASALGNIGDTLMATLTDPMFRPTMPKHHLFRSSVTSGSAVLETNGQLTLLDMHSTSVIATNDVVRVSIDYPLPLV